MGIIARSSLTGIITDIIDCGSVVQVYINDTPYAADGNLWRRGPASVLAEGDEVRFSVTDFGGLASIAPLSEEDA